MAVSKKVQLNVRISPIYNNLLEKVLENEKQKGNDYKKYELVERAIVLLAAQNNFKNELKVNDIEHD